MFNKAIFKVASSIFLFSLAVSLVPVGDFGLSVTVASAVTKTVLTASDFTYLGAMRVPYSLGGPRCEWSNGGLTGRMINGQLHLFMTCGTSGKNIEEFLDTQSYNTNFTRAPRMTLIRDWGDVTDGKRVDPNGQPIQSVYTKSIYWSEEKQLLYLTYQDPYNVVYRPDPSLIAAALNSDGTHTSYGPWTLSAGGFSGSKGAGILYGRMPDGTLAVGDTLSSGNGGSPWGPTVIGGVPFPTASTPTGASNTLVGNDIYSKYSRAYTTLNADGTLPAGRYLPSLRRNGNYVFHSRNPTLYLDPAKNNGVGSWTDSDFYYSGVRIVTANKQGFVFFGRLGIGDVWYGTQDAWSGDSCGGMTTGPHAHDYAPWWWIFDLNQMNNVKTGALQPYDLAPVHDFNPKSAISPQIQTNCGGTARNDFLGSYFEPTTNKLYVVANSADTSVPGVYNHLIHVFQISDSISTQPQPVPTATLSASPTSIIAGSSATLTWSTSNATSVSISPTVGNVAASGNRAVSPTQTTTYTLTATNAAGPTTKIVTVTVTQPQPVPTATLSASPTSIIAGSSSTLTWSTTNATSVSINQGIGTVASSGTRVVSPTTTTTYTLTATNALGSATSSTTVTVNAVPTPTLQGDLNNDHIVNSIDWSMMNSKWFRSDAVADLNRDGIVNSIDFSLLNANWFRTN